jgi:hypothetical protein
MPFFVLEHHPVGMRDAPHWPLGPSTSRAVGPLRQSPSARWRAARLPPRVDVAVSVTLSMKFEHGMLEFHGLGDTMAG